MDPRDFYRKCLEQTGAIVKQVRNDQLANETPDDEWTVRDLANHILYEVSWVPDIVAGRTVAEVGSKYDGDLFHEGPEDGNVDLSVAWDKAAHAAEQAVAQADPEETAHLSYTDTTAGDYLQMTGGDILVHSWDLAKGIGVPITFDPAVAEFMWQRIKDHDMGGSGLFKPPVTVPDDATAQDKIIGHMGRDPDWRPSA